MTLMYCVVRRAFAFGVFWEPVREVARCITEFLVLELNLRCQRSTISPGKTYNVPNLER
jgi:hypothetical protein